MTNFACYFILFTALTRLLTITLGNYCGPPVTHLQRYGTNCSSSSDCVTKYCHRQLCVCDQDEYFDICSQACLPNCNSTISAYRGSSGRISGPLYPSNSAPYICTWTIRGYSLSSYVVFSLTDLDVCSDCLDDYFEVRDEENSFQLFHSNNTNDSSIRTFTTVSRTMKIIAKQAGNRHRSFTGVYRIFAYDHYYSSSYDETLGNITSPGFPLRRPKYSPVMWTFRHYYVTLQIWSLQLRSNYDTLTIYRGSYVDSPLLATVRSPGVFFTNATSMRIVLKTDETYNTRFYGFNATFFARELGHGFKCDIAIPGMCRSPDLICKYDKTGQARCLCPVLMNNRNKCLKDLFFPVTVFSNVLTLKSHEDVRILNYSLIWSATGDINKHCLKGITSGQYSVGQLTPGQNYTFQIISHLAETSQYYDSGTVSTYVSVVTLPSTPGSIVEDESNLKDAPYFIKFQPSIGIVQYYKITFMSVNSNFTYKVDIPELNATVLTPSTEYNYTITAYNVIGNSSGTTVGSFKTGSAEYSGDLMTAVISASGATMFLIIMIIVAIVVTRCRQRRTSTSTTQECIEAVELRPTNEIKAGNEMAKTYLPLPASTDEDHEYETVPTLCKGEYQTGENSMIYSNEDCADHYNESSDMDVDKDSLYQNLSV